MATLPAYAELHCRSNFSFLTGASSPEELVERAAALRYAALAVTDECSLSGVVHAYEQASERGLHLIIGAEMRLEAGVGGVPMRLVVLATTRRGYGNLSQWITAGAAPRREGPLRGPHQRPGGPRAHAAAPGRPARLPGAAAAHAGAGAVGRAGARRGGRRRRGAQAPRARSARDGARRPRRPAAPRPSTRSCPAWASSRPRRPARRPRIASSAPGRRTPARARGARGARRPGCRRPARAAVPAAAGHAGGGGPDAPPSPRRRRVRPRRLSFESLLAQAQWLKTWFGADRAWLAMPLADAGRRRRGARAREGRGGRHRACASPRWATC